MQEQLSRIIHTVRANVRLIFKKSLSRRKSRGQPGRQGKTLNKSKEPDDIKTLNVDRKTLPNGKTYRSAGTETRQVVDSILEPVVNREAVF